MAVPPIPYDSRARCRLVRLRLCAPGRDVAAAADEGGGSGRQQLLQAPHGLQVQGRDRLRAGQLLIRTEGRDRPAVPIPRGVDAVVV
eukprot:scaffold224350_cov33-Prasinocladus_malaysianus.AAC.2